VEKVLSQDEVNALLQGLDGDDAVIKRLFEVFYPQQDQNDQRLEALQRHFGAISYSYITATNFEVAVGFQTGIVTPIVILQQASTYSITEQITVEGHCYRYKLSHLFRLIWSLTRVPAETVLAGYMPRQLLVDTNELVHAVVLADSRLLCCLETPMHRAMFSDEFGADRFGIVKKHNI